MMKMVKKWMMPGTLVVSLLLLVGIALAAPNAPSIEWWVIGGGGESTMVGSTSLDNTMGQWVVGSGMSGTMQLGSGFWGGGSAAVAVELYQIFLPVLLR